MEKPFFIMMYCQGGESAMPIVDGDDLDDDSVAFYETEEQAREIADNHHACQAFGYEIFEMGCGM